MTSAQNGPKTAIINIFDKYIGAVLGGRKILKGGKELHFYLSVIVFTLKVLIVDTIFLCLQLETGPPFNVVIQTTQNSTRLHCNGSTFIS